MASPASCYSPDIDAAQKVLTLQRVVIIRLSADVTVRAAICRTSSARI